MPFARWLLSSTMVFCEYKNLATGWRMRARLSTPCLYIRGIPDTNVFLSEPGEQRIFNILLQMIPELKERLMEGSNEDIVHIGELVCYILDRQLGGT
jgi:hypothetical protein